MTMTGNCSRCGRTETVFDLESSDERLCGRCITSPVRFDVQAPLERHVPHARIHFTEIPGCPECVQARRARL